VALRLAPAQDLNPTLTAATLGRHLRLNRITRRVKYWRACIRICHSSFCRSLFFWADSRIIQLSYCNSNMFYKNDSYLWTRIAMCVISLLLFLTSGGR
jgi:hypothetical protein